MNIYDIKERYRELAEKLCEQGGEGTEEQLKNRQSPQ
nr:MAG TPA: hypothetical protein [Caudoviricetes sp.]